MEGGDREEKIILDLCGGSGSWGKPYALAGYTVHNITLPDHDVRTWHTLQIGECTVLSFNPSLENRARSTIEIPLDRIHGVLAAPPCTMFSLARAGAKTPRNFDEGLECVRACLEIIWLCRAHGSLKWWAMENPVGYLRQFMGVPAFTFQAWQFGDDLKKPTDLWGYFKRPRRLPGTLLRPSYPRKGPGSWSNNPKSRRAITPPAFAQAFFRANP